MRWLKILLIILLSAAIGASGGFVYWSLSDLPEIKSLEGYTPFESSFIYSSDGKVLAELYLERRNFIPYYNIPDFVKKAFIAIEDQRFYSHPGMDIVGIIRAFYKNLMAHSIVEGGSTITQQLTKMLFLKPEKSLSRKIKEAIIAVQIEKRYTKDEILGMYLNQAYFGTRAYGIEAAAQTYFGKSVTELSISDAALLAGLQKAPALYSPFKNPEKALMRRQLVLKKMLQSGFISQEQYEKANAEPLPAKPFYRKYEAPYFVEHLRHYLESRYGNAIYTSGLKIYSTIDYNMQKIAEEAVARGIASIEKRVKKGVQAALIAIDLRNGHIKALVGGTDFWETQFNRATMALRQPGSAFKPFVYAAAIENGMSESDEILDSPVSFPGGKPNQLWSPKNYDGEYHGYVPLKTALALSLNAATVRLANDVGIQNIIDLARQCGIKSTLQPYLPIALGASDVTLLELTSAYGVFATGNRIEPVTYEKIVNRDGVLVEESFPFSENVLEPETVDKIKELLRAVIEMGTATKAKEIKRTVYGKTGTTNDFSDAWFVGFDDSLVVGVWVGRDNHKPIGPKEAGARAALPIWIEFMKNIK
ncbi:penicillin-binding protein [Dissulfurispira thermophila]|uniref:Penicillin-binding protein n=2 Tax=root TaxID=1 RepID=A0A7G1H5Z8_9BACT|nr:penicillin-binding protein 1A [Dissulfurispira thermophila]BCB97463.1 penicillin-binding protein [Dissulfurispira thermophila]